MIDQALLDAIPSSPAKEILIHAYEKHSKSLYGVQQLLREAFDLGLSAYQLSKIRSRENLKTCAGCSQDFIPAFRAKRGTVRFCDDCRKNGQAHRVSVKLAAAKKKES